MNMKNFDGGTENEPGCERLYFEVAIGAAGAVGAVARRRGLAAAPTRASAGLYTWLLSEGVQAIVDWNIQVLTPTPTTVAQGTRATLKTRTPGGATPGFVFQTVRSDTGAAADPASGDVIAGYITVKTTTA